MNQEMAERLINNWRSIFFIEPILSLFFIFSFTVGLLYHYNSKERFFFTAYFFSGNYIVCASTSNTWTANILTEKQATILLESATLFLNWQNSLPFIIFSNSVFEAIVSNGSWLLFLLLTDNQYYLLYNASYSWLCNILL
jgi:hypothetical protein